MLGIKATLLFIALFIGGCTQDQKLTEALLQQNGDSLNSGINGTLFYEPVAHDKWRIQIIINGLLNDHSYALCLNTNASASKNVVDIIGKLKVPGFPSGKYYKNGEENYTEGKESFWNFYTISESSGCSVKFELPLPIEEYDLKFLVKDKDLPGWPVILKYDDLNFTVEQNHWTYIFFSSIIVGLAFIFFIYVIFYRKGKFTNPKPNEKPIVDASPTKSDACSNGDSGAGFLNPEIKPPFSFSKIDKDKKYKNATAIWLYRDIHKNKRGHTKRNLKDQLNLLGLDKKIKLYNIAPIKKSENLNLQSEALQYFEKEGLDIDKIAGVGTQGIYLAIRKQNPDPDAITIKIIIILYRIDFTD